MTIFGKQTVGETRHLMKTVEFRIEMTNKLLNKLAASKENVILVKDWNTWNERWAGEREKVLDGILAIRLASPLVGNEDLLESQALFDRVQKAIGSRHEVIALTPLIQRFESATGEKLDEANAPMPANFDPDHAAYKAVDSKIKAGEAAAKAAATGVKDAAKSNIGLIVIGAAVVVVGGFVAVKVYL